MCGFSDSRSTGIAARDSMNVPRTLTSCMRSYFFASRSVERERSMTLALLMTTSMPPNSPCVLSTASVMSSSLRTSPTIGSAWPPAARIASAAVCTVPSSFGCGLSVFASSTMFAPSAAARSAMARPMPRLPPDIRMVFPASDMRSPSGRNRRVSAACCEAVRAPGSLRRHADGAVEADRLAVEVVVGDDVLHESGVLIRTTEARRVGHLLTEGVLCGLRQAREHRGLHDARGDRADPDGVACEFARDGKGHGVHAALGRRVRRLADLSVERGDAGGVHDDAALPGIVGRILRDHGRGLGDDIERAHEVDADDPFERAEVGGV